MKSRISPHVEKTYEQLRWVMRRRFREVESVAAHFGRVPVERALAALPPAPLPEEGELEFRSLLGEKDPLDRLALLATDVLRFEATTVAALRARVSLYREHVDEQILFGARTAGQEAGRTFPAGAPPGGGHALSVPEAVQAVFELSYAGLPGDRSHFLVLRPRGGSSVHFTRSPLLDAWAGADPRFLFDARCEWVRGVLDIVAPGVELHCASAIEQGAPYGLEHFYRRGEHAGP